MKSKAIIFGLLEVLSSSFPADNRGVHHGRSENQKENDKSNHQQNKKQFLSNNGLKEFYYTGGTIEARNQKNADRKARNKGYL